MANKNIDVKLSPSFTEASTRENISSGENIKTTLGKIKKFFTDLKPVAFSGDYNDLSNTPNIPDTSTFVQKSGDTMTGNLAFNYSNTEVGEIYADNDGSLVIDSDDEIDIDSNFVYIAANITEITNEVQLDVISSFNASTDSDFRLLGRTTAGKVVKLTNSDIGLISMTQNEYDSLTTKTAPLYFIREE